ncbi:MAG: deoxyribonuclease V [Balneolaceae bacterium]|jgi:deoxyribonuclease V
MVKHSLYDYKRMDPATAKKVQEELRAEISLVSLDKAPGLVGGADISFNRGSTTMHAAIVVLELSTLQPLSLSLVTEKMDFPYIPGLLAFREMPVLWNAWRQLEDKPDVLILDGHGIAHPRRMGIATHFGIEADHPTVGCAKNVLIGTADELPDEKGAYVDLKDGDEKIGMVLRSRSNVKPIYVSPGHKLSFGDAYSVIMRALTKYKLPQTARLAHLWANKLRKGEVDAGYCKLR